MAALILLFAATLARAVAGSAAMPFAATVGVGTGIAIAGALVGGFVKTVRPDRAALAMGVYTASLSLGSTLAAAFSVPLSLMSPGWRLAAGAWAIGGMMAILAWRQVGRSAREAPPLGRRASLPVRRWDAWAIAAYLGLRNIIFYAVVSRLPGSAAPLPSP